MLNHTGITKVTAVAPNQILFNVEHQLSVGILCGNTGVTANTEGKKILKAGTPMAGSLTTRGTAYTKVNDDTAVGILLHDVDVTAGANNGTLLIFGFVNTDRIDDTTAALITADVKTALPMIKFLND